MHNNTTESTITAQITVCEERLIAAIKVADIEVMDELLHDALLFNIPNGFTITKAMDLENYKSGLMQIHNLKISDRKIEIIGDDTAIVVLTAELDAVYGDESINGKFRYLRVWKHTNDKWQIIAGSSTTI